MKATQWRQLEIQPVKLTLVSFILGRLRVSEMHENFGPKLIFDRAAMYVHSLEKHAQLIAAQVFRWFTMLAKY